LLALLNSSDASPTPRGVWGGCNHPQDTFKTYIEERTAAKERGDAKPEYKNDALPKKLAIPVIPSAAPLLVQMVVAGSLHQLYNPALKRINLNVYAAAAHDAMLDISRFV
jgi:hypothetical protein